MDDRVTRRDLLRTGLKLAVIGSALPVLSACGKKALTCDDPSQLSTADKQLRATLQYVDKSPQGEAKNCNNCEFFTSAGDAACGTCTLVKGPIHPLGYCTSWAAKV